MWLPVYRLPNNDQVNVNTCSLVVDLIYRADNEETSFFPIGSCRISSLTLYV